MRDLRQVPQAPGDWHAAFAALPADVPPADGWSLVAARLGVPRARRRAWFAVAAAAAVLALVAPFHGPWTPRPAEPVATTARPSPAPGVLPGLYAESQSLEALLAIARDDRVATGTAAALAGEFDARIAGIDAVLSRPDLRPAQQVRLWQARVELLRSAAGFEGTRRWLAAHGARYDASLVQVD